MLRNHLVWDRQRHGVGIAVIDDEHQRMIELVNRINDLLSYGKQIESAWNALDELLAVTEEHFAHEEEIMAQRGYPDMAGHVEEHRKLLEQVRNLIGQAQHSPSRVKVGLVSAFLADWAEQHILQEDRRLGAYLAEHGKDA